MIFVRFFSKLIHTWIPYIFQIGFIGIQCVLIFIVVMEILFQDFQDNNTWFQLNQDQLFEKIQFPNFLLNWLVHFFEGVRPKHPPLREARAKVWSVGREGRRKDRRDKRGQSPFGTCHHVIYSAGSPSGRGLLAHDGHPSGRFGSRPFSTCRRVGIWMAFLYL